MFKRNLDTITIQSLRGNRLFTDKLGPDIEAGAVFPAIRAGRIDFYHKGGKLFSYEKEFSTHKKYAAVIKSKGDYISELDLEENVEIIKSFFDGYERIRENCSLYSGVEAKGVSRVYHKCPFTNKDSNIVVLDIEISFEADSEERSQDRVDMLLLNKKTQQLRFCEAKHYSNSELWSMKGTRPKVVSQIERYQEQIERQGSDILREYGKYVEIMNGLFEYGLPEPKSIDDKVTLLVFGFDRDQQKGRMEDLLFDDVSLTGIQHYFIGSIAAVSLDNMWKAVKCG